MGVQEDKLPGCPLWVTTFGDCMSLLMTFFVMICAFTNFDEKKVESMIGSLQQSLGFVGEGRMERHLKLVSAYLIQEQQLEKDFVRRGYVADASRRKQLEGATTAMLQRLAGSGMYEFISIAHVNAGLAMRIQNAALFAPQSTALLPQAEAVIRDVAALLAVLPNTVLVQGHADAAEQHGAAADSWELSGRRAAAVAQALLQAGLARQRLTVGACADTRPLVSADTAAEQNRRVEIIIQPEHG